MFSTPPHIQLFLADTYILPIRKQGSKSNSLGKDQASISFSMARKVEAFIYFYLVLSNGKEIISLQRK